MAAAASMNTNHFIGHANQIPNISSFPLLSYIIRCPSPAGRDNTSRLLQERKKSKSNFYLLFYFKGSFTPNVDARFDVGRNTLVSIAPFTPSISVSINSLGARLKTVLK